MGIIALVLPLLAPTAAAALGLGTLGAAFLVTSATLASGFLTRQDSKGRTTEDDIALKLRNTRNTISTIPIIYGTSKVGGNDVFLSIQPSDPKYLWIVQTLCEGECEGVKQHDGNDLIYINNKLVHEYDDDLVQYTIHNGTNTQTVDTLLNAQFPEWTDTLRNTTYIVFRFKYDPNKFNGIPTRHIVLNGKRIFDFDTETFTFSNNPVRILYDYLTNPRYGLGIPTDSFDNVEWLAIANDIQAKEWGFDYVISQNAKAQDVIELILVHFRGVLTYFDGIFSVLETEYFHFNDRIIRDDDIAVDINNVPAVFFNQSAKGELPDGIYVKYITKTENWSSVNVDTFSIGDSRGKIEQLSYVGCLNKEQANDLALYYFERQLLSRTITVVLRDNNVLYSPNDIVGFICSEFGIGIAQSSGEDEVAIPHRIIESTILSNGQLQMILLQEDASLYDKEFNPDPGQIYELSFPDPSDVPPGVVNFKVEEVEYVERERTKIKLYCTFDQPLNYPWFSHVNIAIGINDSSKFADYGKSTGEFYIDAVTEENIYYIRVRAVSDYGVIEPIGLIKQHTIDGIKKNLPISLSKLFVNRHRGSITLSTKSLINYNDIAAYEFRLGETWNTAIFIDRTPAPLLTLGDVKPSAIVNLVPNFPKREHTFWINTLGTNGLYGETPISASLFLQNPPIGLDAPLSSDRRKLIPITYGDPNTIEVLDPSPWNTAILTPASALSDIDVNDVIYVINGSGGIRDSFKVIAKSPPQTLTISGAAQAWPAGTRYFIIKYPTIITFRNMSLQNIGGVQYIQCDHENNDLSGTVTITGLDSITISAGTFYCMYDSIVSGIGINWNFILESPIRQSVGTITAFGGLAATLTNLDDYNAISGWVRHYSIGTLSLNAGLTEATLTDNEGANGDWDRIAVTSNISVGDLDWLTVIGKISPNILQITGATTQWIDVPFVYTGTPAGETYGTILYVPYPTPTNEVEVLQKIDSVPPVFPYDILLTTPETFSNLPFAYDGPIISWRENTFSAAWTTLGGTITVISQNRAIISDQAIWDLLNVGDYLVIAESLPNTGLLDIGRIKTKLSSLTLDFYSPGFKETWTDMPFTVDPNPKKWSDLLGSSGAGFKLEINVDYKDGTEIAQHAAKLELLSETYTEATLTINSVVINIEDPSPSAYFRLRSDIELQRAKR